MLLTLKTLSLFMLVLPERCPNEHLTIDDVTANGHIDPVNINDLLEDSGGTLYLLLRCALKSAIGCVGTAKFLDENLQVVSGISKNVVDFVGRR